MSERKNEGREIRKKKMRKRKEGKKKKMGKSDTKERVTERN